MKIRNELQNGKKINLQEDCAQRPKPKQPESLLSLWTPEAPKSELPDKPPKPKKPPTPLKPIEPVKAATQKLKRRPMTRLRELAAILNASRT